MEIWVDADACPRPVKEILYRAAQRVKIKVTVVSNLPLRIPRSPYLEAVQVAGGPDVADDEIIERMRPGDLVITADIPLAAEVVEHGGTALDFRGDLYTEENVRERLSIRDFMADLREQGVRTSGPSSFDRRDRRNFANQLDRLLTKHVRARKQQSQDEG